MQRMAFTPRTSALFSTLILACSNGAVIAVDVTAPPREAMVGRLDKVRRNRGDTFVSTKDMCVCNSQVLLMQRESESRRS